MIDIMENAIESNEDTLKNRYLTFSVDEETYGIGLSYVREIVGIQPITTVPELPDYVKGIINLRGRVIPVIDIRLRFRKAPKAYNDRTCIIVIEIKGTPVGLITDTVSEVVAIPEQNIVDPPQISMIKNKYVGKIGKVDNEVKLLLDCEQLLGIDEFTDMNETL